MTAGRLAVIVIAADRLPACKAYFKQLFKSSALTAGCMLTRMSATGSAQGDTNG